MPFLNLQSRSKTHKVGSEFSRNFAETLVIENNSSIFDKRHTKATIYSISKAVLRTIYTSNDKNTQFHLTESYEKLLPTKLNRLCQEYM